MYSFASAQNISSSYEGSWKLVDSLLAQKGLYRSALSEVDKIYVKAKKENRDAQLIKAIQYKSFIQDQLDESTNSRQWQSWEQEISGSNGAAKALLQSLLARAYYHYLQDNSYNLYDRTPTGNPPGADVETWTLADLNRRITQLYLASIRDEKWLQQTALEKYEPLITKGNLRPLRPTLYDLLTHEALQYFKNPVHNISDAANNFELSDPAYFSPAAAFGAMRITTKDSSSLYHKALLIYQRLLQFHARDSNPAALIDADIERLTFVHEEATIENKDSLYEKSLLALFDKYKTEPAAAKAAWLVASLHAQRARQYDPASNNPEDSALFRNEYLAAVAICKTIIAQKDSSEGRINCENLLAQIERKELRLTVEKVNLPGQSFRALVNYRNTPKVYLRLIALDKLPESLNVSSTYWKNIVGYKPIRSWEQAMPATQDYQDHSAEIKIDGLPIGSFLLLASSGPDFKIDQDILSARSFYVSSISYICRNREIFVLDRQSGKPLAGATVQAWLNEYDDNSRITKKVKGQQGETDANGYLLLNGKTTAPMKGKRINESNVTLEFNYKNDHLFLGDADNGYYASDENDSTTISSMEYEKDKSRLFLFTDRSIYRPGQIVYFKGIALTKDMFTGKTKPYAKVTSTLYLRDANDEEIDSLQLTTGEYGSYSGKFILPASGLKGSFSIVDDALDGRSEFNVEEYKRPRFFADYQRDSVTYKIGDTISLTLFAKAYAGNNISGAMVSYRVRRTARFMYPWRQSRLRYSAGNNKEIAHGIATTDADGRYIIRFPALADSAINKNTDPVFEFQVMADVTDLNGETRSAGVIKKVSYKSLQIHVNVSDGAALEADSLKNISIRTSNIEGILAKALVDIRMSRLRGAARLIKSRYWQRPDEFVMSRDEYISQFPHDEYQNESDYHTWPVQKIVYSEQQNSDGNMRLHDAKDKLESGWYIIEASTRDMAGQEVKDVKYIRIYDEHLVETDGSSYAWSPAIGGPFEPGTSVNTRVISDAPDIFLIREKSMAAKDGQASSQYAFSILNGNTSFSYPLTEADRGGIAINYFFVKDNRFYMLSHSVDVPWTNKQLKLGLSVFRDKILPGSHEKWTLHMSGPGSERVNAELMAGMYDASLDQFKYHQWSVPDIWRDFGDAPTWNSRSGFAAVNSTERSTPLRQLALSTYDRLENFPNSIINLLMEGRSVSGIKIRGTNPRTFSVSNGEEDSKIQLAMMIDGFTVAKKNLTGSVARVQIQDLQTQAASHPMPRKNFNETAFFFPDLKTDSAGNTKLEFTVPEALTTWKFQALAHTKDLAMGYTSENIITQKTLMVQPNAPRFLREGDKIELSTKVVNLGDKELTGTVQLELINPTDNQPVDGWFHNMYPVQYFTAAAGQSVAVNFPMDVPFQYNGALIYRFVAKSGDTTDGEEAALPVLTNRTLVTEALPLTLKDNGPRTFHFESLLHSDSSETLQHHSLAVEFTTNPAWYAVQAIPYLMEYPYECAEQSFNRYYANALAAKLVQSSPRLKTIFNAWQKADTAALLSNLQKNPELKSALLEETPWALDAKNESTQKKNIAILFDEHRLGQELSGSLQKIGQMQSSNGGFVWFPGGPDDRYITQYILSGIGHLKKLGAIDSLHESDWKEIAAAGIKYLDRRIAEDYAILLRQKADLSKIRLGDLQVQYLYARSFFPEYAIPGASFAAVNFYRKQTQQFWLQQSKYMQGMIALALFRTGDKKTAADILKSLRQAAVQSASAGMYWKENTAGYYWYQSPVQTQSLLIEAFAEINRDNKTIDELKTWLLQQKQTSHWNTTMATADACYALLMQGTNWTSNEKTVLIKMGDRTVFSDGKQETGTGYFRESVDGPFVKSAMGDIVVKIPNAPAANNSSPSWGTVYWQYFEGLDKIKTAGGALRIKKKMYLEKNSDSGPVLEELAENAYLKLGDKVKVRLEIGSDRNLSYVHLKDMRAACLEPVNVLSGYKWQGGLGYYESTGDLSTSFFFDHLMKGTYVLEYTLFVSSSGNFSNGITTLQCMYAPEFAAHTEGIRLNAEANR